MEIWERLKEERERMGLTQSEFAAIGGASKASQSGWETGATFPNAKFLAAVAEAGADVSYILTGVRTPRPAAGVGEGGNEYRVVSRRQAAILELLEELGEDGLDQVQGIAEKEKRLKDLEAELARARKKA